ncbi:uncharacterized protein LOC127245008 [Andrographis paniculata]|uniref:uncharacterized protein LOC127245008 n=1 Tax=Andrographis paniculata TaxID=175694 RepID=UPI0021E86683|nr:uncharacterized protein LOC127245008 [Andrographis paniculata]
MTPFGHFMDCPKMKFPWHRLVALVNSFSSESMSFKIGSDIELPFEVEEYSVVLGLHAKGVYVTENTSVESEWFVRIFGSKPRSVTRGQVLQKLREALLQGLEPLSVADVARLFIMFVFANILFCSANYSVPLFLLPYVEDLSAIGDYAWGPASHRYLLKSISDFKSGKKYLTGCTAGLLAWFNERVPTLDKARCLPKVPRLFRWLNSLGPMSRVHAVDELTSIKRSDVQEFYRIGTEEKFVRAICHASEEAAQEIAALKVELRKKDTAIARLAHKLQRSRAGVVDDDSEGEGEDESDGEEGDANYGDEGTADRMAVESERKEKQADMEEKQGQEEESQGEEEEEEEKEEKTGEEERQTEEDPEEAAEEQANTERRSKKKMDILLAEVDPINESDDEGVGSLLEFNQLMAIVPYVAPIDVKQGDDSDRETCSRAADSSIVRGVMARKDRKRKKKPEFVTPVSTPRIEKARRTRRAKGKSAVDVNNEQEPFVVGDDGDSDAKVVADPGAQKWEGYRNNDSYCGKGSLSEDETNTIEHFLASFAVRDTVWQQGVVSVSADAVLELLFDEAVKGEVIDAYLYHLCSNEYQLQHNPQVRCGCVPWFVAKAVNDALSRPSRGAKKPSINKGNVLAFANSLQVTVGQEIAGIMDKIRSGCRYIFLPVHTRFHWHLCILDTVKRVVLECNSMRDPFGQGNAKKLTRFLSLYMNASRLWPMVSDMPEYIRCRHQGETLDCGPLVCMFAECYARAGPDVNVVGVLGEDFGDVKSYRGTIAARILKGPPF